MYLSKNYKKYKEGGDLMNGLGTGFQLAGALGDMFPEDEMGRKPLASSMLSSAAKFGQIGAGFGPVGAIAGGVLGAGIGLFTNKAQKRKNEQLKNERAWTEYATSVQTERSRSQAALAANPSLIYGNSDATYYKNGGTLTSAFLNDPQIAGGRVKRLSHNTAQLEGNTHDEGGIQLPSSGVELEDQETIHNDYVFSSVLGFAKEHKTLASAAGKIEAKPHTKERANALERINQRTENLKLTQEFVKAQLGVN